MALVQEESKTERRTLNWFSLGFALSQLFGFTAVIIVGYLMNTTHGLYLPAGLSFGTGAKNESTFASNGRVVRYHPIFMTVGMIFLQGEAILMFRVFRHEAKIFSKVLHAGVHLLVIVCIALALYSMFRFKYLSENKNLYSTHAWVGGTVNLLYVAQWVLGFVSFLFPKLAPDSRKWFLPVHRFVGLGLFVGACSVAFMGIHQWTWLGYIWGPDLQCYAERCGQAVLMNLLAVDLALYAATVSYLVVEQHYKRVPLPIND